MMGKDTYNHFKPGKNENIQLRTWFLMIFITLTIIIAIIAVLELYCGFRYYKYRDGLKDYARSIRLKENPPGSQFSISGRKYGKSDTKFIIDSNGYVFPSEIHKNPDIKIFFIGGSTTECAAVDQESRFPYLVGRVLEKSTNFKINSINSGVSGNNSLHSINILINKIIPEKPDIVVFMHNINDVSTLVHTGTYWNDNRYRSPIIKHWNNILNYRVCLPNSRIIRNSIPYISLVLLPTLFDSDCQEELIKDEWSESDEPLHTDTVQFIDAFRKNINTFISICKINNIEPVLMTQASNFDNGGQIVPPFSKHLHSLFNIEIRKIANDNKVLLIDLAENFSDKKMLFFDALHFSDKGSVAVSKYIADALTPGIISYKK